MIRSEENAALLASISLPLGGALTLEGGAWTVVGVMRLEVFSAGPRVESAAKENYLEYHLIGAGGESSWLVEELGYWTWLRPLRMGFHPEPAGSTPLIAKVLRYGDEAYERRGNGVDLEAVAWKGEFAEAPDLRARIRGIEFYSRKALLAAETSGSSTNVTYGVYLPAEAVARAAGLPKVAAPSFGPLSSHDVAHPLAPNPYFGLLAAVTFLAALTGWVGHLVHRGDNAHLDETWTPSYAVAPLGSGEPALSPPFAIGIAKPQKVEVVMRVEGLLQQWVEVNATLLSEDGKAAYEGDLEMSNYGGSDWSEDLRRRSMWFAGVPAGEYRLKLARTGGNVDSGTVEAWVRPLEESWAGFGFFAVAVAIPPVVVAFLALRFRTIRNAWGRE